MRLSSSAFSLPAVVALTTAVLSTSVCVPAQALVEEQRSAAAAALDAPSWLQVIDLQLPGDRPAVWTLDLSSAEIGVVELALRSTRAANFSIGVDSGAGSIVDLAGTSVPAVSTYRGTLRDRRVSVGLRELESGAMGAFGALFADSAAADRATLYLQPLESLGIEAPSGAHVVYQPRDQAATTWCGVGPGVAPATPAQALAAATLIGGFRVAEIAFDVDVDYYVWVGSSLPAVMASIEQSLDAVNLFYERDVEITHRITRVIVRTAEPDPYSGNDAGVILGTQFRGEWRTNQTAVPRDMAHFITSRGMGNILGLAYVGVVCGSSAYGLSRFRDNFGQNTSVLGHELGHNWSAPHCLDTCDVMCGCGAAGGFGPNDRALITAYRDTRTCLTTLFPELVGHFRLDDPVGSTTAADASRFTQTGTVAGGLTFGASGARSQAGTGSSAQFDGVDDAVVIAGTATGFDELHRSATVAAWVNPVAVASWQRVFGGLGSWNIGLQNGTLIFANSGVFTTHDSGVALAPGRWTHVAVAVAGDESVTFWVDGQNVGTQPGGVAPGVASEWVIGRFNSSFGYFAGGIDDVQVYAGVLDDLHVAHLFANPGAPVCSGDWQLYGNGLAGTLGVPTLAVAGYPLVGRSFTTLVGNSLGGPTTGLLALGLRPASLPLLGGTLLVDPSILSVRSMAIAPSGGEFRTPIPDLPSFRCQKIYLQSIQFDPAAPSRWSMTQGLEVEIGG